METTLPARLRRLMKANGWKAADIARESGATRQAVSQWLRDGERSIDGRFAFNLQRASGFSAEWLMYGTGPERAVSDIEQRERLLELAREMVRILGSSSNQ